MSTNDPIQTSQDEFCDELVAYLDEELDEEARDRVSRRLLVDAKYRERLEALRDAWLMLDSLPPVDASEKFTQSTVEMVAISTEREQAQNFHAAKRRRAYSLLVGVGAVLLATLAGFAAARLSTTNSDDALLRDLRVIENLDLYVHTEDIDFLRQLQRESLFVEEVSDET